MSFHYVFLSFSVWFKCRLIDTWILDCWERKLNWVIGCLLCHSKSKCCCTFFLWSLASIKCAHLNLSGTEKRHWTVSMCVAVLMSQNKNTAAEKAVWLVGSRPLAHFQSMLLASYFCFHHMTFPLSAIEEVREELHIKELSLSFLTCGAFESCGLDCSYCICFSPLYFFRCSTRWSLLEK